MLILLAKKVNIFLKIPASLFGFKKHLFTSVNNSYWLNQAKCQPCKAFGIKTKKVFRFELNSPLNNYFNYVYRVGVIVRTRCGFC